MRVKIATWNVNSIRARLPRVSVWLEHEQPDLLCMQETKVVDEAFPREAFHDLGYHVESFGQKTYNGVAIVSRAKPEEVLRGFPEDAPGIERRLIGGRYAGIWILNVYVPHGTELGTPRFDFKLDWLRRLRGLIQSRWQPGDPILVCGDFNVAPEDRDVHDPDRWRGQLLFHPDEQAALRALMEWGLHDAFRLHTEEGGHFSWWDYRAGAFHRGWGLRIDLVLVSDGLREHCRAVAIDREARKGRKPSDHAPVVADLA
ncbi:MAG: exodeoxyribonuclease III [Candidatus Eisenbacteria bacterium]|nr:exodeoxyribonuclease III [Candidatus Eisenbacteria bacterium]